MTKEEKELISIEIDKYFRGSGIGTSWFASHLNSNILHPKDGFEPQSLSKVNIDQASIRLVIENVYEFSGSAEAIFSDNTSNVRTMANVHFGGQATTRKEDGRTIVIEVVLTRFHRTSEILPIQSDF